MKFSKKYSSLFVSVFFILPSLFSGVFAQVRIVVPEQANAESAENYTWWYALIFFLIAGLAGAIFWQLKDKKAKKEQKVINKAKKLKKSSEDNSVDFDLELEWYRKNKSIINKKQSGNPSRAKVSRPAPAVSNQEEDFTKKVESFEFSQLPIARFDKLAPAKDYSRLPLSNDDALMSAIEQTQDELEEDENVRELAVKILARFKTRNSVEALSQVALYDLSSTLRSKAVNLLSEFDHESVFETLLLACADPTREIRAAAARGLFRLNFDRAGCWTRIAENGDEYRMRHAARAAIAGDLVERSFDRLVHEDRKVAYEVFTLIVLLIRAGETKEVFNALEYHRNPNVRKGILHIIKVTKEHNALDGLYNLLDNANLNSEMREKINRLVEEIGLVAA